MDIPDPPGKHWADQILQAILLIMTVLGKWFKLKPKLTSLLAVGSSICGVSAIIAAKGAIEADDDDATFAIAAMLFQTCKQKMGRGPFASETT